MRRREFISLLSGAVAWPFAARAQQGVRAIGVLVPADENDPVRKTFVSAFTQAPISPLYTYEADLVVDQMGMVVHCENIEPGSPYADPNFANVILAELNASGIRHLRVGMNHALDNSAHQQQFLRRTQSLTSAGYKLCVVGPGNSITFSATISDGTNLNAGTVMNVSSIGRNYLKIGLPITGPGVAANTTITGFGTGTGGAGTYTINNSQLVVGASTRATTNAPTRAGNSTLFFATGPTGVTGCLVRDVTNPAVIPRSDTVLNVPHNKINLHQPVTGVGVASGDVISFVAPLRLTAQSSVIQAQILADGYTSSGSNKTLYPNAGCGWILIEGQNEPDLIPGKTYAAIFAAQGELFSTIRADPTIGATGLNMPILGPSMTTTNPFAGSYTPMATIEATGGNWHPYNQANQPEAAGWLYLYAQKSNKLYPTVPQYATEFGYTDELGQRIIFSLPFIQRITSIDAPNGSTTLTFSSTGGVAIGNTVSGSSNIPSGTAVLSMTPTTVGLSTPTIGDVTANTRITFTNPTTPGDQITTTITCADMNNSPKVFTCTVVSGDLMSNICSNLVSMINVDPDIVAFGISAVTSGSTEFDVGFPRPKVTTSAGVFPTITHAPGSTLSVRRNPGSVALIEKIAARYFPRLILTQMQIGWKRTYIHQIADAYEIFNNSNSGYGMIRLDSTLKPCWKAIKNMIALFADPSAPFRPQPLDYWIKTVSGDTSTLASMAFQRSNGKYMLAVWLGYKGWDNSNYVVTPFPPPFPVVNVQLPTTVSSVQINTFNDDGSLTTTTQSVSNGLLQMTVTDNLSVLVF
jgi:hypothetical protein